MLKVTRNTLEAHTLILKSEVVITVHSGSGGFCGAFVCPKKDAEDMILAIDNSYTRLTAVIHPV